MSEKYIIEMFIRDIGNNFDSNKLDHVVQLSEL